MNITKEYIVQYTTQDGSSELGFSSLSAAEAEYNAIKDAPNTYSTDIFERTTIEYPVGKLDIEDLISANAANASLIEQSDKLGERLAEKDKRIKELEAELSEARKRRVPQTLKSNPSEIPNSSKAKGGG